MNERALRVLEFEKIKELIKNYAVSKAGKDKIDSLKPYDNPYLVKEHLLETDEAFKILFKKGSPPFSGLYDVRETIVKASKGFTLLPGELLRCANLLRCSRSIKKFISQKDEDESYRILENLTMGIVDIKHLEDEIFNAIIGETEISDRASKGLYDIRRNIKEKTSSIKSKVNSLIRTYSQYLQEDIFTVRGDRYVLPVKIEYKGQVQGLVHDQSSSGATLFIEPISLVNLNNEIRELKLKEKAEIERILSILSSKIYDNVTLIKSNSEIVWEIDFIFAKGKYAYAINGILPKLNEDGHFNIISARHPLINPKEVVTNDIYMEKDINAVIITGPNTGGKTVTLKTVGLLHLMALSGVMIPASDQSSVSFYKEIFADIGDEQSIEQSLSTFSSHMTNIVHIIDKADENSLLLFDELGAGTDPTEGAALAVSILENLKKRSSKIFATTHYSELKAYAIKADKVVNASVEFDVESLRPTYKLLIGVPGKSNAFEISKRLGLPDYIINEARKGISEETLKFEDLIQNLQYQNIKAQKDAIVAEGAKSEAMKIKTKYEEKLNTLQNVRERETIKAKQEAKNIIKEAKEEADKILKEIRKLERMGYSNDVRQKLEEERLKLKNKLENTENSLVQKVSKEEMLDKVKEGEEAYLPKFNTNVVILSKPDNKGELQVQAGIMKVTVNIKDLRRSKSNKKEKKVIAKREAKLNLSKVSSSIDLRGMDSQEAVYQVDKYLDEAYLAGLAEVTIIHGKGTGVLKKAVKTLLRKHIHVKSHRPGAFGEGGDGVSMVLLK
ncbi:endonuclease MutS2 [Clostridium sediminicola]|uniref:endonuclease MutS2 n=1 Tax=Clostridium sediminicola TaxID=3114879 RepID=UPI0031F20908